jgi:hypothetical protein
MPLAIIRKINAVTGSVDVLIEQRLSFRDACACALRRSAENPIESEHYVTLEYDGKDIDMLVWYDMCDPCTSVAEQARIYWSTQAER